MDGTAYATTPWATPSTTPSTTSAAAAGWYPGWWGPAQWASQQWEAQPRGQPHGGPHAMPAAAQEMAALADASAQLRNMQRRLSLVQGSAAPLPRVNPLPHRWADPRLAARVSHLGAVNTKVRKSMTSPWAANRLSSELYPIPAPPVHRFFPGRNTRLIDRVPDVKWS